MNIYIDARNVTARPGGVARYAQGLIPELVKQAPAWRWILLRHTSNRTPLACSGHPAVREVFVPWEIGKLWDFIAGGLFLRRVFAEHGAPALYHSLFHIAPLFARRARPKLVVTLHDLIWLEHPHASQPGFLAAESIRLFGRIAIGATLRAADRIICVSASTAGAAYRRLGVLPQAVVAHGVESRFFEAQAAPCGELGRLASAGVPYVMAVGNDKPYKNLGLLVEAFARHVSRGGAGQLVLVGPCEGLRGLIAARGIGTRVTRTGYLGEDEFCRALAHATLFVFPSLAEGFGLPPLEAMALRVPTAIADIEPLRSSCAEGALRFAPDDPETLAGHIRQILSDGAARARWSRRGRDRALQFTWERAAKKTLEVYRSVTCAALVQPPCPDHGPE